MDWFKYDFLKKVRWNKVDELYAEFDEELKQIVLGKKLEGADAIKALEKIAESINKESK
jgi:hypothetical protein